MDNNMSYLYGFLQADGNLSEQTRNRGRITLEICKKDEDIIHAFDNIITENTYISERHRKTNFGENDFIKLSIYDLDFRNKMKSYGFPVGKKDDLIEPPKNVEYSINDYVRGLIDGDGSLGLTNKDIPFVSFITKSEKMKDFYIQYLFSITGKLKTSSRNKRDNAFNIAIYKEDAQKFVKQVYYKDSLTLKRKEEKAKNILSWVRPATMKKRD